ncbi:MAG: DUF2281 domain-containing protein [Planctomycetia bacterium]|nr:DUF2281 domain-containing protein [Candidatus Brocadia sp.]QOJ06247.1 MAG: DUF2281 domain-containing protein [Planctomycetia bacterium]TVL94797.1 MAG: hypothetical protein CV082_13480 [Candidatus Brocadia sp. BL1]HQU32180.1 DUF2281 domain-containing protein [Candidatus Brocadia sapporoensis]
MINIKNVEADILQMLKLLPENKRIEVLDFVDFLIKKSSNEEYQKDLKIAVAAVEETWGSIKLDKKTLKYVAEDKEMEYET